MRRRFRAEYEDRESFSPWETYSDLYCGLLLVFVLLFFFAIYQYIDAREKNDSETAALQQSMKEEQTSILALYKADLENQEAAYQEKTQELEGQRAALAVMQADLDERTELLNTQQEQIDGQKKTLEEQQGLIHGQQMKLEEQQTKLDGQEAKLEEQQTKLDGQEAKLKEQEATLVSQEAQLKEQAGQIEQIVGVRGQLIDELNQELAANQIQVQADRTTGAIVFESTVLFANDSNTLSEEGKLFTRKFMPVYLEVLLRDEFRDYIAEIIVEGHTDDVGSYLHNLDLSQRRAWSVAEYFMRDDCEFLDADTVDVLKSLITVNGCANKAPVYREDGTKDAEKSRRVEIKFRLRDQEMIQEMDEILNNQE